MILLINTADQQKVVIGLVSNLKSVTAKTLSAKHRQAEELLPAIAKMLSTKKIKLKQLTGIAVVTGPGPFTALRIGVVTANTLAWTLKLPVVGLKLSAFNSLEQLAKKAFQEIKTKKSGIVLPFYGREPHITKKK